MGLRRFERRLEHLVEGTFARVFKSGLTPLEMGRRIVREIDANQSVGVDGAVAVPNHFWLYLSSADHERFADIGGTLSAELAEAAREHIRDERYRVLGPVTVTLVEAPDYPEGTFQAQPQWREGPAPHQPAHLLLIDGRRIPLTPPEFVIGRMTDCELVVDDESASRHHAAIRAVGFHWVLSDLGSTNGTTVNDRRVESQELVSGDVIGVGAVQFVYETA